MSSTDSANESDGCVMTDREDVLRARNSNQAYNMSEVCALDSIDAHSNSVKIKIECDPLAFSEETCSTNQHADVVVKAPVLVGVAAASSSNTSNTADVPIKVERFNECYIKNECPDEVFYSTEEEVAIKREVIEFGVPEYAVAGPSYINPETTEKFLNKNPEIFTKFCGLSDFALFNALLEYISDDMEPMKGVTKYEQLFSVLTKLHKNEENLYLNKYMFTSAYVLIIELLYKKLNVLCKQSLDLDGIPSVLLPEFDCRQKVVIFGILRMNIESISVNVPTSLQTVKYLIGYTAFGEVFFVSRAFIRTTHTLKLIINCGVLQKLDSDHWVLIFDNNAVQIAQVNKFFESKSCTDVFSEIHSPNVNQHIYRISNSLTKHFKVLENSFPYFMLHNKDGTSFLDKLVFVCCMLQNMLPRCVYH